MKSRLLLLTGIVALAFVGPIDAPAATINISDFAANEGGNPSFTQSDFTAFISSRVPEVPGNGTLVLTGTYVAENPLAAEVVRTVNINMNDPVDDGPLCCSDTLSIIQIGAPGGPVALTCPPPWSSAAAFRDKFLLCLAALPLART